MNYQDTLDAVHATVAPRAGRGLVAADIPALSAVDPSRFGLALATVDGAVYGVGDWQTPFSVQSVSKVFALALVLNRDGETIWRRVGREPSGSPYNSLHQLAHDRGIPAIRSSTPARWSWSTDW